MTTKETFNKAYGHIPKELPGKDIWYWIPNKRSFKYFYLTLWRKMFR